MLQTDTPPFQCRTKLEAKAAGKMAHSSLLIFTLIAALLNPVFPQSTCPACDCKVSRPPVVDQIITTKIARVLNGQPSKSYNVSAIAVIQIVPNVSKACSFIYQIIAYVLIHF